MIEKEKLEKTLLDTGFTEYQANILAAYIALAGKARRTPIMWEAVLIILAGLAGGSIISCVAATYIHWLGS